MKKVGVIFSLLFCCIDLFAFESGGLIYNVLDSEAKTVSVGRNTEVSGNIVIPSTVTYSEKVYSVTTIGDSAFFDCSTITSISLPNSVTSIGWCAFYACTSLTSINIPEGVTSIGDHAFQRCTSLTSIILPEGVTSLGEYAFSDCSNLTSINIPEGVTSIGDHTFEGCTSLTSINIPEGVTSLGVYAFYACTSLTSINIPEGVTSIGSSAFRSCHSLTSIIIPEGVTSIGGSAFYACTRLTSINIPEGVTSIREAAFYGCSRLTSINIPEGVTSIGSSAFQSCYSLTSIILPEGVTSIGNYAFDDCSGLTSINIPEGVTSIGECAFSRCSNLTSINIPEGVTSIGNSAFCDCSGLTSINIPEGVTSIGTGVFQWCSNLTSITLPNSLTSIRPSTFEGCTNLTSINIPEGVTSIGTSTFEGCTSLTSITLPNSLKQIDSDAFRGCGITSITIPRGVTSIATRAFYQGVLDTLSLSGWVEAEGDLCLNGNVMIYVPCGLIDAYQADEYWKQFPNIVEKKIEYSPEIALVTASQEIPEANLVVWQKEQTVAIDYYTIYRELAGTGTYEELATIPYDMQSIYVDEQANNSKQAHKYKISATNFCGDESPVSPPHKTIHLEKKGSVSSRMDLVWDNYEGFSFDQYSVYRVTSSGIEEISKEVAVGDPLYIYEKGECVDTIFPLKTTITYTDIKPVTNTRAYYVAVKLPKEINVNDPLLKAEEGPFSILISNIAEVENMTAIEEESYNKVEVFTQLQSIVVKNSGDKTISVYNAEGKPIARSIGDCTTTTLQKGAYIVVVGEKTYKVMVE